MLELTRRELGARGGSHLRHRRLLALLMRGLRPEVEGHTGRAPALLGCGTFRVGEPVLRYITAKMNAVRDEALVEAYSRREIQRACAA